jgi:hypothetical protein
MKSKFFVREKDKKIYLDDNDVFEQVSCPLYFYSGWGNFKAKFEQITA